MARRKLVVTHRASDPTRIPDRLAPGALLFADLEARGVVKMVAEKLKIRRQGGFTAVDVWLVVLLYLTAGVSQGLRPFWEHVRAHVLQLAALAGRRRLPTPASVSRALGSVELEPLRQTTSWMLTEASGVEAVLRHPSALTYDAKGEGWHVFDLDPTAETLRHRALPVGDDLPDAMRRSEDTGAPGHAGRKRGDVQFRRVDVQHAGSGVWAHAHLHTGNGEGVVDVDLALGNVGRLVDRLAHPRERTLVRLDGEFGSVPFFATLREHRLPFVTRLNRHQLYDDVDVLRRLREAEWHLVPDSGSGPTRSATDLGILTIEPGRDTRRPDGGAYEPATLRVVASRYPRDGAANRGRVLDGWQVELFAADVTADVWPAPEVVASYFGRSGQENRLAQEDREVALGRIVSYHLPGQELATVTGLFLLNVQIARGFEREPPPSVRAVPTLRRPRLDTRAPAGWPRDPVVTGLLGKLDWKAMLGDRPGWTWDPAAGALRCEQGRELVLTTVRAEPHAPGRTGVIFCRPAGGCEDCAARTDCLRSGRPAAAKHAEFSVPTEIADRLRERLALVRGKAEPTRRVEVRPVEARAGLHAVIAPRFLPTEARRAFRAMFAEITLHISVELPPSEHPRPRLVAADEPARQHRRATWERRVADNALPEEAVVHIDVSGHRDLRMLLAIPERGEVAGARRV